MLLKRYLSADDESAASQQPERTNPPESFETDTQRIVHRHLQNKNDVITDEDIASVRIGMMPSATSDPEVKAVKEEMKEESLNDSGDAKGKKATPWDTLQEDDK